MICGTFFLFFLVMALFPFCHCHAGEHLPDGNCGGWKSSGGAVAFRLRPVIMTALAAGLALVPFAFAADKPGNEILSPLAVVILGGLLSSTALNMIVIPSLYVKFGKEGDNP
jgi:hypothetical protein